MVIQPALIVQVPAGSDVAQRARRDPPSGVADGAVVVEQLPRAPDGDLEVPDVGEVVASVLAPEAFGREPAELRDAIDGAGPGTEPLIVIVEAAEELRDEDLDPVIEAARRSPRPVIVRIQRDA